LADQIATKRKTEVLEGKEFPKRRKRTKLSEHIKNYTEWSERENRSAKDKDHRVLDGLLEFLGDRSLDDVKGFDIERWKTERSKQVAQATVNRELNVIRGCFARAVEWKRLMESPLKSVKPYRVDNVRTRILSVEEIQKVLEACPPDLRLIARTTLESLLRLSEVLNLRREDIGPTYATVVQSKSGKARKVPLTPELRTDLFERAHKGGFIFGQGEDGNPPTGAVISVAFGRLMRKIGLSGVSHHVLRHTGASAMVAAGVSLRVVQEIGGWTSLRMLERYAHPTGEEMERAVRVLSAQTAGTKTGTAANRGVKNKEPETRKRVVGLEDWAGVPNGIRYFA
jgi:integrase